LPIADTQLSHRHLMLPQAIQELDNIYQKSARSES
jgi:hypothetical protein